MPRSFLKQKILPLLQPSKDPPPYTATSSQAKNPLPDLCNKNKFQPALHLTTFSCELPQYNWTNADCREYIYRHLPRYYRTESTTAQKLWRESVVEVEEGLGTVSRQSGERQYFLYLVTAYTKEAEGRVDVTYVHFECAEARTTIELAKKALKAGKVG
jgi:hypothetical protein